MKQNGKYMLHVLLTTFICLALVSARALIISTAEYYREQQELEELSPIVSTEETTTNIEGIHPAENSPSDQSNIEEKYDVVSIPEILPQYADLHQENSDLFGWIRIKGTVVDYPVMYSPNNPEFYLNHAFDLTESQSGIPFLDADCTNDGFHYLLYGHHLKNGGMFAAITKYADADFLSSARL